MRLFGWVLGALAGWTAIGIAGTALAWATGDRRRAWKSLTWLGGAWVLYVVALLGTGTLQKQKTIVRGQEECFDAMCFSVAGVVETGEFKGEGAGTLVQVGIRVRNAGRDLAGVEGLRGYLVDMAGGAWEQTPGVGGVGLTVRLPSGGVTVSEPVFRVPEGTKVSGLVLTRGHAGWGWLEIGDTDAVGAHRTVLRLE